MTLSSAETELLAERLDRAALERAPIAKITNDFPEMTWEDAYSVQQALRRRIEGRGEDCSRLFKAGLTSRAKMLQMGVSEPAFGFLLPSGQVPNGGEVSASTFIHPRIEAEIAVRLNRPLKGPGCHIGTVLAAIGEVMPAIEILDSRFENFNFDLKSVIADNTSASGWVVGDPVAYRPGLELSHCGLVLRMNGEIVQTVSGAAVLGHPAQAIAMLANLLARRGEYLPSGALILTGGASAAIAVGPGDELQLSIQGLGSMGFKFT